MSTDKRPDPKPRKYARLWQAYLAFDEIQRIRVRHDLRISSIEKGKSNMDLGYEEQYRDLFIGIEKNILKELKLFGQEVPVWDWVNSIKGISVSLAAKLLAQIDDISKAPTVSSLWRYAGKAVVDGKAEKCAPGETAPYNRKLKATLYLISDSFIKQQTPVYVDIYYQEKARLRELYPEKIKDENGKWKYNDGHLHNMAKRKVEKIFLQHLWIKWREAEGLPISLPYVIEQLGHAKYIEPVEVEA